MPDKPGNQTNGWHAAMALIVMLGLVAIVALVIHTFNTAGAAASVLGTIVPGIAAVAAAGFGVPIAYQTGKAGKEEAVVAAGANGKSEGKKEAVRRVQAALPPGGQLAAMGSAGTSLTNVQEELLKLLSED